jgi:hypothetical protein
VHCFTLNNLNMVKVTGYALRERNDGTTFVSLEISGGLEFVQSSETGKFYATIRKANIPATFGADIAELLVGTEMEGKIVRVQCDPYEYVNKRTGEIMTLGYSYAYQPAEGAALTGHTQVSEMQVTPL